MSTTHHPAPAATRRRFPPSLIVGLAMIAVGVVLLLDRADVLDAGPWFSLWWPLGLLLLAGWWFVEGNRIIAAATATVAVLLLAITHDLVDGNLGNLILPILLVAVGAAAINGGQQLRRAVETPAGGTSEPTQRWHQSPTATAVFGDARLTVADDGSDRAAVTAISVFGDVEVAVPAGWRVTDRTTALFGSVKIPRDQPTYAEAPVVELHGLAIFGDAKVRYLDDHRSE